MNYFQFYRMPVTFFPDQQMLNRKFFEYNKLYRPEFYLLNDSEEQMEKLELSEYNNRAYQLLSDLTGRIRHILELKQIAMDEGDRLPEDFEAYINSVKEKLEHENLSVDQRMELKEQVREIEQKEFEQVEPIMRNFNFETTPARELEEIRKYYFKRLQLLRILKLLDNFDTSNR